jgi:hypothetical protein
MSLLPHDAAGFRTSSGGRYFLRSQKNKTCFWGINSVLQEQAPASLAAVKLDLALVRRAGYFPACWQIFAAGQRGRAGRGGRGQHNA